MLSLLVDIDEVCPENIHPCTMKNGDIYWRYKTQETLYTGQWRLSPLQSRHLGTPHSSLSRRQLPLNWWSERSSLLKIILILGKPRSHRVPNLGCRETESPRWFDVLPKISARDVMHEWVCSPAEAANHQLPIAVAFWIIWIVSMEECSSLT